MYFRNGPWRALLVAVCLIAWAAAAGAQTGRVGGVIKDDSDQAIKGATIRAENPNASPSSFTAVTDEKGRFSIIGLRTGLWTFTVEAAGFAPESRRMNVQTIGQPNPPLMVNLKKGGVAAPSGAMAGVNAKDLQTDLAAADQLYNTQQWDPAIAAYKAILARAPALSVINLQIAAAYRNKKDYDAALTAYNELLKIDPANEKAKVGIGMTNLEKGDMKAAEEGLLKAAESATASREVYYTLGEVKFAKGETDDAAKWYQKAADTDAAWGKPWFKLGLVAVNKGNKDAATKMMEKVIAVDPMSPEAAQAKAIIEQLKK
jgi:Tfp pilus assembly protein PilF